MLNFESLLCLLFHALTAFVATRSVMMVPWPLGMVSSTAQAYRNYGELLLMKNVIAVVNVD